MTTLTTTSPPLMSRLLLCTVVLLLASPADAAPQVLTIGNCVYKHQSTTGTVEAFTHTCWRSDNVDEPIAVDCRTKKVARFLDAGFIIPGRSPRRSSGWQGWESPDPEDVSGHLWLLIKATCP